MLGIIKEKLLEEPNLIKDILEHYEYANVVIRRTYITFGRANDSSPKSIVIRLENNENLLVHDYPLNMICDIFNFIIKQRNVSFRDVISYARMITGVTDYYNKERTNYPFGGFYKNIKSRSNGNQNIVLDESILNKYKKCGNERFLKDGITLETQKYFGVGYSIEDQAITIPIRDEFGQLIGVKARINKDVEDGQQKYFYLTNECIMSNTLYGYCQNYQYIESSDSVYVGEAEKFVQQAWSFGNKNCLSLGSSSISKKQAQMILSLNAKNIYLMFDKGLDEHVVKRNISVLRTYGRLKEFNIYIWIPGDETPDKSSPTDLGKECFEYAIEYECISEKEYLKLYE